MQEFFAVRTSSGLQVAVGEGDRLVAQASPARPVIIAIRADHSALAFMFAPAALPGQSDAFVIEGVAFRNAVQPWRIRRLEDGVTFFDPILGHVLAESAAGSLALQTSDNLGGSQMHLSPVALSGRAFVFLQRQTALLALMLPANLNGPDYLDALATSLTTETAEVAQAVLRALPLDQIRWLAGSILGLPGHLARFAAAYPDDVWANEALPSLREWVLTRRSPRMAKLPPRLDFLAGVGMGGYPTTIGHLLNSLARAGVPPRRSVCVVATARNEGLYLLEWIAYHRLVGAEAIVIYSNDNSDGSDDLLRSLALSGEIIWIENDLDEGRGAQPKAYGHAFGLLPGVLDYRWSLVIDLDEFFAYDTRRFRSLQHYIEWQEVQRVDAVSLNWLVYGSAGKGRWEGRPLVERFTKRFPGVDVHIKSLSRTNQIIQSSPHHGFFTPMAPALTRDSEGQLYTSTGGFSFAAHPTADAAWIAHYFFKSAEEFVWKFSRNRGDHALLKQTDPNLIDPALVSLFVGQHLSPTMVDDDRARHCAPGLDAEIARLHALPNVAAALRRVHESYRLGTAALFERMQGMDRFTSAGSSAASLLSAATR